MAQEQFLIAQIGRTVGLWGDLKLHLHTDFPEQFKTGHTYKSNQGDLTVADINFKRGTIKFRGYESVDSAKKLTNTKLFADLQQTKEYCSLEKGQYFWFDIIGCAVVQEDEKLGVIDDVQRMADVDYLAIKTDNSLVKAEMSENFLLPYIDRYVINADIDAKILYVKDAKDVLEAS